MAAGLAAGKDFFVFPFKSYSPWAARLDLDSYPAHPTKKLILRGAGGAITTVNSDGFGFFEGGAGWKILVDGIQFQGSSQTTPPGPPETEPLCRFVNFELFNAYNSRWEHGGDSGLWLEAPSATLGEVDVFHCLFDRNGKHGLEMERVGNFNLIKAIAQRNANGYGLYSRFNRTTGIMRGAHLEANGVFSETAPSDWGINVSFGDMVGVFEAYCSADRIWVDDSSCEVRNCAVARLGSPYNNFSVATGSQPTDPSMISGFAAKFNNFDVAQLPNVPCPHT